MSANEIEVLFNLCERDTLHESGVCHMQSNTLLEGSPSFFLKKKLRAFFFFNFCFLFFSNNVFKSKLSPDSEERA